jgi:iron complex outermembrane receptor protein
MAGHLGRWLICVSALATSTAAMAQVSGSGSVTGDSQASQATPDSEIVVTAQRRSELSRDVPIAITNLSAATLQQTGTAQLADIAKLTPALRFDAQGTFFQPTIRGVGTAITTSGGGPNVGIYTDGFFSQNPEVANFELLNIESIQVLKGPQGTLFGRNTTGGAILVTTRQPSEDPAAEVRASYGRFNSFRVQGYGTGAIGKGLAVDLEGSASGGDGHITNLYSGDRNYGRYRDWSIRTGLKADVGSNVTILLRYMHAHSDDPTFNLLNAYVDTTGGAGFLRMVSPAGQAIYGTNTSQGKALVGFYNPASTYATDPDQVNTKYPTSFVTNSDTVQGTIKADLGFASLTSYTQWRRDDSLNKNSLDPDNLATFFIYLGIRDQTISQEFLLNSENSGRLKWTAGLNFFQYRDSYDVSGILDTAGLFAPGRVVPSGGSSTLTRSYAGFADATYELVPDQWFITAGIRYSHDTVSDAYYYDANPFAASASAQTKENVPDYSSNRATPRIVVRYKPSHESSVYASYSKGYKAGILNVGGSSAIPIQPESIDAFEGGYKYETRAFAIDLAGYYYNYKNLQVSSYEGGQASIRNAASSEIYGFEAQGRYSFSPAFDLNAGVAYTHARYKSFKNAPYLSYCDPAAAAGPLHCPYAAFGIIGSIVETTIDASGFHMQRAPDFTSTATAAYHTPLASGRFTLSGTLYYTSSFYFDPAQQYKQSGYATLGLRAQWQDRSNRYTIAVYGDNVTDKRYKQAVLSQTLGVGSVWSFPATWGISLGAKF